MNAIKQEKILLAGRQGGIIPFLDKLWDPISQTRNIHFTILHSLFTLKMIYARIKGIFEMKHVINATRLANDPNYIEADLTFKSSGMHVS
jgi:hypothetical protein